MEIKMNTSRSQKMGGGIKNIYPKDWEGDISDDGLAQQWVDEGDAVPIGAGAVGTFSNEERFVLKGMAAGVLENAQVELSLDELSPEQMVAFAVEQGVEGAAEMDSKELYSLLNSMLSGVEEDLVADDESSDDDEEEENTENNPLALKDLDYDELVEMATTLEIDNPRSIKKAALLKLLEKRKKEGVATSDATDEDSESN